MNMETIAPGLGHNRPPVEDPVEVLQRRLADEHVDLLKRQAELLGAGDRIPESVEDDETAGKVGDFVAMLDTLAKNADGARRAAKQPFETAAKAVDGFFKRITDPIERLKKKIAPRQAIYLSAKAERERRELEERARRLREQAEADARAAAEAEAAARRAVEERDRIRREEEAAARRAHDATIAAERAAREQDEKAAAEAKNKADEAEAERRRLSQAEAVASATAREADKVADVAETRIDRAVAAERQASRLEDTAAGRPAGLARTRGDRGSVSTLQVRWTGVLTSRAELDLEALRNHLPADALEQAIRAFVAAGGRDLRGARIFEDQAAQFR
jgi:hypothetical protein